MISGSELFVLFCPGDIFVVVVWQDCLLIDCIGGSRFLVCGSVWITCGFFLSLTVCGCGCSLSLLGLSLSVVVFGVSCGLSWTAECSGNCLSDLVCN